MCEYNIMADIGQHPCERMPRCWERLTAAAIEVLPKPECELLLEFAENAKDHCEQLHRIIKRDLHSLQDAP